MVMVSFRKKKPQLRNAEMKVNLIKLIFCNILIKLSIIQKLTNTLSYAEITADD